MKSKPSRRVQPAGGGGRLATPQRQRGAAAVFGAVAILAGVISLLLGLNISMLYFAQRDLQRQASLAALSGAQFASGCLGATAAQTGIPGSLTEVTSAVTNVLNSNASGVDRSGLLTGIGGQPAVQLGQTTYQAGTGIYGFTPLTAGDPHIDSVRVNLSTPAPSLLGSGVMAFTSKATTLYASATAWQPALGAFTIGTGLANVNTQASALLNPLLSGLLHSNVSLSAVNYNGLAQAQVSLAGLEAAAGVNNLNDLLSANTNLTTALNYVGQAASGSVGGLVSGLAGNAYSGSGSSSQPTQNFFGQIFNNAGGTFNPLISDVASAVPFIDALDLIEALGEDASKNQPIAVQPGSSFINLLNVPGLTNVQTFVTITQPPQLALGPALPTTTASTAQVVLGVRSTVNVPLVLNAFIGADLKVDPATGTLTQLQCPSSGSTNPSATVAVVNNLATLSIGSFDPSATSSGEPLGGGNLINVLSGVATVSLKSTPPPTQVGSTVSQNTGPFTSYTAAQGVVTTQGQNTFNFQNETLFSGMSPGNTDTVGTTSALSSTIDSLLSSLTAKNNLQVCLLGVICVGSAVDSILSALNGILAPVAGLLDSVLQDLEQLLGVQLGTATVVMQSVAVGQPIITTTCLPLAGGVGSTAVYCP